MTRAAGLVAALAAILLSASCTRKEAEKLTFFQLNLWEGLANVEDGYQILEDQVVALLPDVASFCEFPMQGEEGREEPSAEYILGKLIAGIKSRTGVEYYKTSMQGRGTRGILTKHKIVEGASEVPSAAPPGHQEWFYRTVIDFGGREIAVYSSHATADHYSCYLPRGYGDGSAPYGWNKLAGGPVTDPDTILYRDGLSDRRQLAEDLVADALRQSALGRLCIFGGDLNQPSHLDWTEATDGLFDHRGAVIPWSISTTLLQTGFKDAWREAWPDPVANPGITWPVYNKDALKPTAWAPEADERDRIDFVYYLADDSITVEEAQMVGPASTVLYGKQDRPDEGTVLPAINRWCSDHRGLLVTFSISSK